MAKTSKSKSVASPKGNGKSGSASGVKSKRPPVVASKQPLAPARKSAAPATAAKSARPSVLAKPSKSLVSSNSNSAAKASSKVATAASPTKPAGKALVATKVVVAKTVAVVAKPIVAFPKHPKPAAAGATPAAAAGKPGVAVKVASTTMMIVAKPEKRRDKAMRKLPPEPAYRPPLQESVPTNGKMRKNQAGLLTKELEHFRDLLLEKRREIVGDMSSMEREALRSGGGGLSSLPVHMADMGTDNYEQEFTLGLVEKDRNLLREINAALAKIQNGTYGLCEGTGNPINKVRLEAQPWARFSIEHARAMERQRGIR